MAPSTSSTLWPRVVHALAVLIICEGVMCGALWTSGVRHRLRWWIIATPALAGRTIVLQLCPVSGEEECGPVLLAPDAPGHRVAAPQPVPTAIRVSLWAPDQHQGTLGPLGAMILPLTLLP